MVAAQATLTEPDQPRPCGVPAPADLPLADEAEDRDGPALDALRISLGPAIPHWPAGLRVDLTVQGDIVQHASIVALTTDAAPPWPDHPPAARRLDSRTRLFALTATRLRNELLAGRPADGITRLREQARRARTSTARPVRRPLRGRSGSACRRRGPGVRPR